MRSINMLGVFLAVVAGCALPPDSRKAALQDAPVTKSIVEDNGRRVPIFELSQVRPSRYVEPKYPQELKEKKLFGEAIIRVLVDANGDVVTTEIRKSDPIAQVGEFAQKAVSQWRFPRFADRGVPLAYYVDVPVVFAPEGTPIL